MPAASAPNMPVSVLSISAPASRLGTISTSALPATLESTPLARAAAADMALSTVSGPSMVPPVIRPCAAIFTKRRRVAGGGQCRGHALDGGQHRDLGIGVAQRMREVDRVLHDLALGREVRGDIQHRVG